MEVHLTLSLHELNNLISTVHHAILVLDFAKSYYTDQEKIAMYEASISEKEKLLSRLQTFLPSGPLYSSYNNTKEGKNEDEKISRQNQQSGSKETLE